MSGKGDETASAGIPGSQKVTVPGRERVGIPGRGSSPSQHGDRKCKPNGVSGAGGALWGGGGLGPASTAQHSAFITWGL